MSQCQMYILGQSKLSDLKLKEVELNLPSDVKLYIRRRSVLWIGMPSGGRRLVQFLMDET